jgi:hypothetical protein
MLDVMETGDVLASLDWPAYFSAAGADLDGAAEQPESNSPLATRSTGSPACVTIVACEAGLLAHCEGCLVNACEADVRGGCVSEFSTGLYTTTERSTPARLVPNNALPCWRATWSQGCSADLNTYTLLYFGLSVAYVYRTVMTYVGRLRVQL